MFCSQCGKEVPAHYKFCQNCGTPAIATKSAEAPENLPVDVPATSETTATVSSTKKKDKPEKSHKKKLLLCGIPALAVLILIGFFIIKNVTVKETVIDGIRYRVTDSQNVSLRAVEDASLIPRNLEIPSQVKIGFKTYNVYSIGTCAFEGCEELIRVELPETVEVIYLGAFSNCTSLKQIDFTDNLLLIEDNAFSGCTSLTKITLPDSVSVICSNTFSGCTSLKEVDLPDSIIRIYEKAFYGCTSLEKIELPNSVISIGWYAFQGCSSLRKAIIPDSVQEIDLGVFYDCPRLSEIVIPRNLESSISRMFPYDLDLDVNIIYWENYNK